VGASGGLNLLADRFAYRVDAATLGDSDSPLTFVEPWIGSPVPAPALSARTMRALTSVRVMARMHYPLIPSALVPDAYPSLRLIAGLRAPLLILHGEDDAIVPADQGRALFEAAPEPKELRIVSGVGHNDIVSLGGNRLVEEIASWAG